MLGTRKAINVCAALLFAAAIGRDAFGAEPRIVATPKVDLYSKQSLAGILYQGQIVLAEAHPSDPAWMLIHYGDKRYEARAAGFETELEARARLSAATTEAGYRLTDLAERIKMNDAHVRELRRFMGLIRFDGTIQYTVPVRPQTPESDPETPGVAPEAQDDATAVGEPLELRHVDKIPSSRVRRQVKRWRDKIKATEEATRKLRRERRQLAVAGASSSVVDAEMAARFKRFREVGEDYLWEPHAVIADKADLYQRDKLVSSLDKGAVVLARPDWKYREWLWLRYGGTQFSSRAKHYRSRFSLESDFRARVAGLEQSVENLEAERALLHDRERRIRSLRVKLQYRANLNAIPTTEVDVSVYGGREIPYAVASCPQGAVEEVSAVRARRLIRDWDKELDEIESLLARKRRPLDGLLKELASAQQEFAALKQAFDEAAAALH